MNDLDQRLMLLGRLLGTVRGLPTAAMYLARPDSRQVSA